MDFNPLSGLTVERDKLMHFCVCACVSVCVRARVCMRVCVCWRHDAPVLISEIINRRTGGR